MSVCSPALATQKLPTCTQELIVGIIEDADTNVGVLIKDVTTGRIEIIQTVSDADGLITLDISGYSFAPNHTYELSVFLAGANIEEGREITIEGGDCDDEESKLIQLNFIDVFEGDIKFIATTQTLKLPCAA